MPAGSAAGGRVTDGIEVYRGQNNNHYRCSIQLKGYDYTQPGAYFITICTQYRLCLFGKVVEGEMRLNAFGRIVEWTWHDLSNRLPHVELDAFVVMPNHTHGIVIITAHDGVGSGSVGAGSEPAPTKTKNPRRHDQTYQCYAWYPWRTRLATQ